MKLHTMSFSPNGRKVESLVAHLGLDVEIRQVDLLQGEHQGDEFRALNPNTRIPVLEDGDFVLWESNAILLYLAAKHPESKLVPADLQAHSKVEQWLFWQASHFFLPLGRLLVENVIKSLQGAGEPDPEVVASATQDLDRLYSVLDEQLAGKDFVCGDLSVADFALGAWADIAPLVGYDDGEHANVKAWLERVTSLPGWVLTPVGE